MARFYSQALGRVYLMHAPALGLVKVGWTGNLDRRLQELSRIQKTRLILIESFRGTRRDERRVLERFEHAKVRSEWFHAEAVLPFGLRRRRRITNQHEVST